MSTQDNFRDVIADKRASGKTCFASAFDLTADIVQEYVTKFGDDQDIVIGTGRGVWAMGSPVTWRTGQRAE